MLCQKLLNESTFSVKSNETPLSITSVTPKIAHCGNVIVRGKQYQNLDCGAGGNCFFHAVSRGLREYNIIVTHTELRTMLSDWFADAGNAHMFRTVYNCKPNDIVPFLGHLAHHCPSDAGQAAYTLNWSWQQQGEYLSHDGRWAGGLEAGALNMCFALYGIECNVNLWKSDINFLCEDKLDSETILLMLSNNHFTYLKEAS